MTAGLNSRWGVLGLMFLIGVSLPIQFQTIPALAPFLIADMGLNYTDIGVLTGLFMFPGIFLALPGGLLAARIGDRLTLIAGLAVMFASSLLLASTESYAVMFVARLLGGAGAVFITILGPKVLTDWFVGREIATALATFASSFGLGVGLAVAVLPYIAEVASWQAAVATNAAFAALAIVLLLTLYRDRDRDGDGAGVKDEKQPRLWLLGRAEFVLAALAGVGRGLFGTGYITFMSFLPVVLIAQGMPVVQAGLLTSFAAVASAFSVPLGGMLTDRTGKPNHFIVAGALGAAIACVLVPYFAPTLLWIMVFGVLRGGCTGGIMALPSLVLRPESRSSGFAVTSAAYFVCLAGFPPIGGYLLDATAQPAVGLWFSAALWLAIPVLLAIFKILQHRWIQPGESQHAR